MQYVMRLFPLLILALLAGCQTVGRNVVGIDNFALVEDHDGGILRGAQPSPEGYQTLAARGVKTVINLRDDANPGEITELHNAGIKYDLIRTSAADVRPEQIQTFLEKLRTEPRPIFIHCRMGRDRTGLEVACYRIVDQNWPREKAIKELYDHGYNWALYPGIERYLRTFDPAWFREATASASAP